MSKTRTHTSLTHQLIKSLLVFALLWQPLAPLNGAAAERRRTDSQSGGRASSSPTRAADRFRQSDDALSVTPPAQDASGGAAQGNDSCPAATSSPRAARLTYLGRFDGECGQPFAVAARLTDECGNALADRRLTFNAGTQSASATTDAGGVARSSLSIPASASPLPLAVNFAGDDDYSAARDAASVRVERAATFIRYTGPLTLAVGATESVSAVLTDAASGRPVPGAVLNFEVGSSRAASTTGADGVAAATITLPAAETFDRPQLKINFAGDECRGPAAAAAEVTAYLRTSFVIWGGNNERLRLGQRVNFWGHSWAKQVTAGDYKAHGDFKGYADTVRQFQLCQVNARTTARPPLDDSCWSTKPGQSFPPETILEHIGVIVTTSADKKGSPDFGNIAALVVVKVDSEPRYGAVPGKPGFGTIAAVIADGEGVFGGPPSLAASQTQPAAVLPGQSFGVELTVTNNSSTAAANVLVKESFINLSPPTASDAVGTLSPAGSQARRFGATVPALLPRREGESSQDYQKRLGAADGTVYSSRGLVSFQDATGRALPPVVASSSSTLQLPRLAVGINAPPCVSPGATIPYVIRLTNVGGASAASAAAVVRFADGTSTRVETTNLEPGKVFSATVNWTVPVVAPKGAAESDADYISRLTSLDGKLLKTTASVTWKDALGNDYGAIEQECASVERVPILSQVAPAPPPMLPAQRVTLPTAVRNTGSAGALQARLRATNPDASVFDATPFSLASGNASDVPTTLAAPPVAPKAAGETDEAYQARLHAADNKPIDFALALEWTDAAGNTYGPLVEVVRTTEVLPIVLLSLNAPETVEAGERIAYEVTADNVGHAEAGGINLVITLPDGRVQPVTLPSGTIPPGGRQASVVEFAVAATQAEGQISAQVTVNWRDAAANGYGPMSASAATNVLNPNRPPVVNAGPDQTVVLPAAVNLNGTASDDGKPVGSTLNVLWTKVSGPGEVTFGNPAQTVTTAAFSVEGSYVLRLTASDSALGASDEATIEVKAPPTGPTYGDDADLTECEGVNVVCDENNHLHLSNETTPFNFIWVAVSSGGTIVKLDTDTGKVLGEYFSSPAGQPRNPSRTTVDHNGNVWASNRDGNSVLRIGLAENGQCFDRNGNGVIDTSGGQGDIRPWTNAGGANTNGGVSTAADECVINYTRVRSSGTRHVSVNVLNDVWVSGTGGQRFDLLDGATGQIKRQEGPVGYGGYGGLIDKKGVIWSARPLMRWDTALPLKGANGGTWKGYNHDSYGLCIDSQGNVWNTALDGNLIYKFAPDGTHLGTFNHGSHWAQGCVVDKNDHVWVAHSLHTSTVGHLKPDGTLVGNVTVGNGPTGVAVDAKGKIWATNHNSRNVSRIDPELGPMGADGETRVGQVDLTTVDLKGNLYNYSDMTGSTLSGAPSSGTWSQVFDSGIAGAEWGVIGWNGQVCADSTLLVNVSSGGDGVNFSAPVAATNGAVFRVPPGRYLKVSVAFKRASSGESPFLYSLTVGTKGYKLPAADNPPPTVDAGLDQTATMPNAANLVGNACDAGRVSGLNVTWEKVSGPGAVSFSNAQVPATSATFGEAGEYTLRLTAADTNLSATDEITVLVLPFNDPPAVNAGADQTLILPAAASLAGAVSDDALPKDSSVAISWSKLSGPGEVTFSNSTAPATSATFSVPGDYVLRLVGDDSQLANVDELVVKVYPLNNAPAVSTGDDRTIRLPDKAALDATVTDDGLPLGKTVAVAWAKVSGPGTVSFANAKAADTTATFGAPGTYVLRLTASDTQLSASDELTVLVNPANQPPTVSAGADQTVTLPDSAALTGTVADEDELPEGRVVSTTWSKVSGPGVVTFSDPNSAATTASFSEAGAYVLRLTAGDSALSRADDVAVTVNPSLVNLPPNVNAGPDQTVTLPAKASLVGAASDDRQPAGSTLSLSWSKVSGPGNVTFANAAAAATTAAFSAAGEYVLRLTASDSALTSSDEIAVTVLPVNQPPAVKAGADLLISFPAAATLNGTATDDGQPPGSRLAVAWSKVSGPGEVSFVDEAKAATTATFSTGGKYVLRLTATDSAVSRSDDVAVTVNEAPTAAAGPDQSVHLPNAASLTGAVTDDALPPGKVIALSWSKVSGPGAVIFGRPTAASTSATFGEVGTYVLRLTTNDSLLQASDELTVNVLPPLPPPPTVAITAPADGTEITSPVPVTGTVSNGAWRLEYSLGPDPVSPNSGPWTTIASGDTPVAGGGLGTFDPTLLLNGTYAVRLTATDDAGQTTSVIRKAVVAGDQKVGNFTVSFEDLNVPVAGLPMQLVRTYDSRDKRPGDFGVGWTLGIRNIRLEKSAELGRHWREAISPGTLPQYCLQPTQPNVVTITFPDDRVYKFQAQTTKQCQAIAPIEFARFGFTPMPGTRGSLVPEAPLDLFVVGSTPGPVELLDASDPRLGTYDPTVFRFTDENGTIFIIDQKLGVRSITDTNGNKLTVNRDGVTHSSGLSISFTRDSQGRITHITDPAGNVLTYSYDAQSDLASFKDREGHETRFTYNGTHGLLSIQDPRGVQPIRNEYDERGRLTRHTDAQGQTISYTHDINGRRELITDRQGGQTVIDYDDRGNVVRKQDPLGGVMAYAYDSRGNELSQTDPLGRTLQSTYDQNGNRVTQADAAGVVRHTYNARKQLLTTTDAMGRVRAIAYDGRGNLISVKDPLGSLTTFSYAPSGRLTSVTDPAGGVTRFEYDKYGHKTREVDPSGHEATYTYDVGGNRLTKSTSRTTASGVETSVTSYEYDRRGYLTKTTFPDGSTEHTAYNGVGLKTAEIDRQGRRTTYDYSGRGELTRTTYPDGLREETTFDAGGRLASGKDRAGRVTNYTYDALGRIIKITRPDGSSDTSTYDAAGQLLSTSDGRGRTARYEYDSVGRRTRTTDALGRSTTFTHNANGSVLTMTDAAGSVIAFEYDARNKRTRTVLPDGTDIKVTYDQMSRPLSQSDQAGNVTRFAYDKQGRLVAVTDALGHVTSYAYDEMGNLTSHTDANSGRTSFEYDKLGRRIKRTLPTGGTETYAYDVGGNLTRRTDFNGRVTAYAYDLLNRLIEKTPDPVLGQPKISYSYTPTGKRARMADASGVTTYDYDQHERLIRKVTPQGGLAYGYDAAGRVESVESSNPNGTSVRYSYDAAGRLASVTDRRLDAGTTSYSYDQAGNLAGLVYPNGIETNYTYDRLHRLTSLTARKTAPVASYSYSLGPTGNRLAVAEQSGRRVAYTYDALHRLTNETVAGGSTRNGSIGYTFDGVGNRLSRVSTVEAVPSANYTYDAGDRLTTDVYDANGNTLSSQGKTYAYDFENRIISTGEGAATFVYDGDGNCVSKTVGGVTTKYLIDDLNPTGYAQVLEEVLGGTPRVVYTYGHRLISQRRLAGGDWRVSFYGHDGPGSVRFLTDADGLVTDTYDYDAFGNLLRASGTTPNQYLYLGERFDPDLGFIYLRARYFNPATGRFLTVDAYEGDLTDPLSLHKYLYAHASPVDNFDPSGHATLLTLLIKLAVVVTIGLILTPFILYGVGLIFADSLSPSEYAEVSSSIDAIEVKAPPPVGKELRRLLRSGRIRKGFTSDWALTNPYIDQIILNDNFFDALKPRAERARSYYPVDKAERTILLLHEGYHVEGSDEWKSLWMGGSENYAYTKQWTYKSLFGWVSATHGQGRDNPDIPPHRQATDLWTQTKLNILTEAPELVVCEEDVDYVGIPPDRCIP